ncbi:hypothetical protein KNSL1_012528 [Colletotrichum chrysophilum]|nr:hypothetical protein KNSL1_012528 [Colletotrichum chrysophilum]
MVVQGTRKKHPNVSRLSLSSNPGPQGTPTPLHLTAETQPIVNSQAPVESPGELMPQPTEGTSCEHPADSGVYVLLAIENLMRDSQSWGLFAQLEEPAENLRKVLRQYLSDLTIDAIKPKHRQSDGPGPRPTTKRPNSLIAPEQPAAKRPCLARPMDHRARVSASASPARSRESLERVKFMIRQAKVTYQEQFPCLADLQTSVGALEAKLSDFKLEASKWQAASDAKEYIFKEAQSKQESANHDLLDAQQKLDEVLAVAATLEKTPGASTSKSIANILEITRKEVQTCQDDRELAKTRLNDLSNEINEAKEAYWQAQEKLSSAEQDVLTTKDSLDGVAQALQLGKYLEEFTG